MSKTVNIGKVTVFDHPEATKEQSLKILEEAAETVEAFKEWERNNANVNKGALCNEIADTIQACANLIAALGVEDFTECMEICKKRNIKRGRITEKQALDADGVPIKIDDKLYFVGGGNTPLKCVGFHPDGDIIFMDWEETGTMAYENATAFTHKKPDSWEQLEEDAKKSGAAYWGCDGDHCFECEHGLTQTKKTCTVNKHIDLIRRAKALAGVDDE